eukprot:TRINITY_DN8485_c0_g1_i3.p1 TRINITY_DN8485_c0_g1~~TRINITY_DN8485_c0_g1_i3.p1  ORF type:complete len:207 (+),score=40.06 TRINITY_DN8485_c0_g1_i3:267-887(+)
MRIMDSITKQNDLYVVADLPGVGKRKTDTHLRAKDGKGSFNYRLKWSLSLPMKDPRLVLSAWDFDLFTPNEMIGETSISLSTLFQVAYHKKVVTALKPGLIWMDILDSNGEPQGQIQVSVELVPGKSIPNYPAGEGRDEPNMNPVLEPPDRVKFDPFSPMAMMKELLGADLFGRIARPLSVCCMCGLCLGLLFLISQYATILGFFV